ncbi:MAG: putative hydro-lyase [Pseudomonadota bacterium]|nr:putative hydro-lyase [Pseudomonadota bacterium]
MNLFENPRELRAACRIQQFDGPTSGHAQGYVQANMVILPEVDAEDFRLFCERNPKPCPVLEVLPSGNPEPRECAPGADVRSDLSRYRVFRVGTVVEDVKEITHLWQGDFVTFLLGCSFTAENALIAAGLEPRHIKETGIVPMFRTTKPTREAGKFSGPFVVSMRPYTPDDAARAAEVTSKYPMAHGGPIQVGDPGALGIRDIHNPEYGEPVTIKEGEVPVFWACGVTPQEALRKAKLPIAITHAPGYMFVSDLVSDEGRV